MEDKSIKKFGYSRDVAEKIYNGKKGLNIYMVISGVGESILFFIIIGYIADNFYLSDSGVLMFFVLMELLSVPSTIWFGYSSKKLSNAYENLFRNELHIMRDCICGLHTDPMTSPNSERYFRIKYDEINRIEIDYPDYKQARYTNLNIYHTGVGGVVRLAIEEPNEAMKLMVEIIESKKKKA